MEHGNTELNNEAVNGENFESVIELSLEQLSLIGGGLSDFSFTCAK